MTEPAGAVRAPIDDAGRDRLLGLLREHYAQGRLDEAELSRRAELVLTAEFTDQAAAAVAGLPGVLPGSGAASAPGRARRGGHGQAERAEPSWVPTGERFRDPGSRLVMRVWTDPADGRRYYVPEPES